MKLFLFTVAPGPEIMPHLGMDDQELRKNPNIVIFRTIDIEMPDDGDVGIQAALKLSDATLSTLREDLEIFAHKLYLAARGE